METGCLCQADTWLAVVVSAVHDDCEPVKLTLYNLRLKKLLRFATCGTLSRHINPVCVAASCLRKTDAGYVGPSAGMNRVFVLLKLSQTCL